jgi:Kef-type K+ transport system membrane component KefB
MSLPLLMFVVFGSAKLLAEILENLGQPAIVGEILAGVRLARPHWDGFRRTHSGQTGSFRHWETSG